MREWQPIETAPRDGTIIIVFGEFNDGETSEPMCAQWSQISGWLSTPFSLKIENTGDESDDVRLTHWMPLPAPPGAPQEKGEGG